MGTMTIIGHDVYGNITTKTISLPGYENTGGSYSSSGGSSYTPKTSFESDSLKQSVPVTTTANGIRIEVNN